MEIFKEKRNSPSLKKFINTLKFMKNKINQVGSSSLKSQKYFSDVDCFSLIKQNVDIDEIFKEIKKIIKKTKTHENMYFIEEKVQLKNGGKIKGKYKMITKNRLQKIKNIGIEYVKLDFVIFWNKRFLELSIIYNFTKEDVGEVILDSIVNETNELLKEKNYFKVLKRIFANIGLRQVLGKDYYKKKLQLLNKLFNSEIGELYQNTANLEAIEKLTKGNHYQSDKLNSEISINLKNIGYDDDINIKKQIAINKKQLNKIGKDYLDKISY